MFGVDARPIPAQVINVKPFWDRTHKRLIRNTMSHSHPTRPVSATADTYPAVPCVAAPVDGPDPYPAIVAVNNDVVANSVRHRAGFSAPPTRQLEGLTVPCTGALATLTLIGLYQRAGTIISGGTGTRNRFSHASYVMGVVGYRPHAGVLGLGVARRVTETVG